MYAARPVIHRRLPGGLTTTFLSINGRLHSSLTRTPERWRLNNLIRILRLRGVRGNSCVNSWSTSARKNSSDDNYHPREGNYPGCGVSRAQLLARSWTRLDPSIAEESIKEIILLSGDTVIKERNIFALGGHVAEGIRWIFYAGRSFIRQEDVSMRAVTRRGVFLGSCLEIAVRTVSRCGMHKREVTAIIGPAETSLARKLLKARPPLKNNWPLPPGIFDSTGRMDAWREPQTRGVIAVRSLTETPAWRCFDDFWRIT